MNPSAFSPALHRPPSPLVPSQYRSEYPDTASTCADCGLHLAGAYAGHDGSEGG